MLTAGASFSAALTDKGSVIAWGNLRVIFILITVPIKLCTYMLLIESNHSFKGMSGCIESHETLLEMEKQPVVIVRHQQKVIVKVSSFVYAINWENCLFLSKLHNCFY